MVVLFVRGILADYLSLPRHHMSNYNIRAGGNCEKFFDDPKSLACPTGAHYGDTNDAFPQFNHHWRLIRKMSNVT
jgi:hypothetical protein